MTPKFAFGDFNLFPEKERKKNLRSPSLLLLKKAALCCFIIICISSHLPAVLWGTTPSSLTCDNVACRFVATKLIEFPSCGRTRHSSAESAGRPTNDKLCVVESQHCPVWKYSQHQLSSTWLKPDTTLKLWRTKRRRNVAIIPDIKCSCRLASASSSLPHSYSGPVWVIVLHHCWIYKGLSCPDCSSCHRDVWMKKLLYSYCVFRSSVLGFLSCSLSFCFISSLYIRVEKAGA